MAPSLEGKIAVVTGVSHQGQVGETVAKALADRGAALAICARTQSNVEARAADLRQAGARVLAVATSLTEEVRGKAIDRGRDQGIREDRRPGKLGRGSYPL